MQYAEFTAQENLRDRLGEFYATDFNLIYNSILGCR
jgi:hypothetical protein